MDFSSRKRRSTAHKSPPPVPPAKRFRRTAVAHITRLSDELLLRIVQYLTVDDLLTFQQVSKRCGRIAVDGHLWKSLFYARFVRLRASPIPGLLRSAPSTLQYSSPNSRWLEDEGYSQDFGTNWKRLYKLRNKWNTGSCEMREIAIPEPGTPPSSTQFPLVKLYEGIVFTADSSGGLRAWGVRGSGMLIAAIALYDAATSAQERAVPTALAVDEDSGRNTINVAVGFDRGAFTIYQLDNGGSVFSIRYIQPVIGSTGHASGLIAVAYLGRFVATISRSQSLVVYSFKQSAGSLQGSTSDRMMYAPKILASLCSHTAWPPLTLSLRRSVQQTVLVCIIYAFPLYASGYNVGIQEIRLKEETGAVSRSRIATAVAAGFTSVLDSPSPGSPGPGRSGSWSRHLEPSLTCPSTVSYNHPYVLSSHADNTLTLYLVRSTNAALSIDAGLRLWGHTSAVAMAQVGHRGKAVSVSSGGTEIRIWDLEGSVSEKLISKASVKVTPQPCEKDTVGSEQHANSVALLGGFDEEKVVVLQGKSDRKRALIVYDFTN